MKEFQQKYHELFQFLAGYFHQDWKDDYDWRGNQQNFEAVVKHFKAETTKVDLQQTIAELEEFLLLPLTDEKLHQIVEEEFVSWYTPRSQGMNKRQFLQRILEILKEPLEGAHALRRIA